MNHRVHGAVTENQAPCLQHPKAIRYQLSEVDAGEGSRISEWVCMGTVIGMTAPESLVPVSMLV